MLYDVCLLLCCWGVSCCSWLGLMVLRGVEFDLPGWVTECAFVSWFVWLFVNSVVV